MWSSWAWVTITRLGSVPAERGEVGHLVADAERREVRERGAGVDQQAAAGLRLDEQRVRAELAEPTQGQQTRRHHAPLDAGNAPARASQSSRERSWGRMSSRAPAAASAAAISSGDPTDASALASFFRRWVNATEASSRALSTVPGGAGGGCRVRRTTAEVTRGGGEKQRGGTREQELGPRVCLDLEGEQPAPRPSGRSHQPPRDLDLHHHHEHREEVVARQQAPEDRRADAVREVGRDLPRAPFRQLVEVERPGRRRGGPRGPPGCRGVPAGRRPAGRPAPPPAPSESAPAAGG